MTADRDLLKTLSDTPTERLEEAVEWHRVGSQGPSIRWANFHALAAAALQREVERRETSAALDHLGECDLCRGDAVGELDDGGRYCPEHSPTNEDSEIDPDEQADADARDSVREHGTYLDHFGDMP